MKTATLTGKTSLACAIGARIGGQVCIDQLNGQSCTVDVVRHWKLQGTGRNLFGHFTTRIVDEIDAASLPACNELRSYLDALPPYTLFIGTTNKKYKELQEQLHSRFQVWYFETVPAPVLQAHLVRGWGIDIDKARDIAAGVKGNVRAAILDTKAHIRVLEAEAA